MSNLFDAFARVFTLPQTGLDEFGLSGNPTVVATAARGWG